MQKLEIIESPSNDGIIKVAVSLFRFNFIEFVACQQSLLYKLRSFYLHLPIHKKTLIIFNFTINFFLFVVIMVASSNLMRILIINFAVWGSRKVYLDRIWLMLALTAHGGILYDHLQILTLHRRPTYQAIYSIIKEIMKTKGMAYRNQQKLCHYKHKKESLGYW